ncbi:MAG: methyltransferase domain-containing protein [Desulfosalsimonadaceae bacterium]|nr:methyltransferase domain-containing protein [Desulfosalsimonadaceae bacterium]
MGKIDDEIINRFYGCGSPIPPALEGCRALDLGCGTGRDVYVASRLVGDNGFVIGVDMTGEQLDVANRYVDAMTRKFGYKIPNVDFRKGYIEDLNALKIADESINVVISNCVLNLSPDKPSVFREIFRVLKPGGELFFSDVFAGRRVPEHLADDPVLHGECLAGAMYVEDFRRLLAALGCPDYRVTAKRRIFIDNPEVESKIGMVDFYSMTVRAFKLNELEDICEDYGQVAVYQGSVPHHPHFFDLDDHHRFFTGKPMLVCGNTASDPSSKGVIRLEQIWKRIKRQDVFQASPLAGALSFLSWRNHICSEKPLKHLIEKHLTYVNLEETHIPCHIVATDLFDGIEVSFSRGPAVDALLASSAIPGVFPPVRLGGHYLIDGGVTNNTPISVAIAKGAGRVIVFPTGMSCGLKTPPKGVVEMALQTLNLAVSHRLKFDMEKYLDSVEIIVLPVLCPLDVSIFNFSRTEELIERSEKNVARWIQNNGMNGAGNPEILRPHYH